MKKILINRSWDFLLMSGLIALFFIYQLILVRYLAELERPLIIKYAFVSSAVIACFYEFSGAGWRVGLTGCLATLFVFCVGAVFACEIREEYILLVETLMSQPDFKDFVGKEIYETFSAKLVGYGGCFALGMFTSRMVLYKFLKKQLIPIFVKCEKVPCATCGRI